MYNFQVDFEELVDKKKSKFYFSFLDIVSRGTLYLNGDSSVDRPNYRLMLEKEQDFSPSTLKAFS